MRFSPLPCTLCGTVHPLVTQPVHVLAVQSRLPPPPTSIASASCVIFCFLTFVRVSPMSSLDSDTSISPHLTFPQPIFPSGEFSLLPVFRAIQLASDRLMAACPGCACLPLAVRSHDFALGFRLRPHSFSLFALLGCLASSCFFECLSLFVMSYLPRRDCRLPSRPTSSPLYQSSLKPIHVPGLCCFFSFVSPSFFHTSTLSSFF